MIRTCDRRVRPLLVLAALLTFAAYCAAGTLTMELAAAYAARGATETLPVIIALSDRAAAPDLAELLAQQGSPPGAIHSQILSTLTGRAATTQGAVLKSIEILQTTGMARSVRPLWISNLIAAELSRSGAELVANMAEVSEVGLDETVTLRKVVESTPAPTAFAHVEAALTKLRVPDVWQMGYHGEGRILACLGDGASIDHPALSLHWRGRTAPFAECWYDPSGASAATTCGAEGTFLTGLLCGLDARTGDTLGVAPAASWIAAKVFCGGSTRLSDLLLALQWLADPDGDGATLNDVPDAVCNSWGLDAACDGGAPEAVWEALANIEALGPVLVFAVGNDGAKGPGSVRAPEAQSACFSVGGVDATGASPVPQASSSRGPSPCDPALVKPDVVAPGTQVRSSGSTGFARVTGSGPAAAFAAGTVALLRQANPTLSALAVKRILAQSARDAGTPGADNTFGAGLIDAAAAVAQTSSAGRTGGIEGVVRYGGVAVSGARVLLSGALGDRSATAGGGVFRFEHVPADRSYALSVGRFGYKYLERLDSVAVVDGQTASLYLNLERGFEDDAEHDQGWSLGVPGDNATGGTWVRAVPVGSRAGGKPVQPGADASLLGQACFVTGNAASASADAKSADVDGGRTTLRSPLFSLTELANPELHFTYWYSNDRGSNAGSDFFRVQISSDGGVSWVNLINTAASTERWTPVTVRVPDFVTASDRMLLQFVAEDGGPGSLVEAAVDDISITGAPTVPEPPRDLVLDVQFNQVVLTWRRASGAKGYNVYLSNRADQVVTNANLYRTLNDTTLTVPMTDIPFDEFYFQVTAAK